MKVRLLGCGTSTGVPRIGNDWGRCDPAEPRNRRQRSSILVSDSATRILVDCGPDLRRQLLDADVGTIDAVIVTHDHGDHVHGIDDLRPVSANLGAPVPIHGRSETLDSLQRRFGYAFDQAGIYKPIANRIEIADRLTIGRLAIRAVDQPHGSTSSLGLRFEHEGKSIAYAVDFNALTDEMAKLYQGVNLWIADCLTRKKHPTHAHLDAVIGWARELGVGQLVLTHMGNGLDYRTLCAELPSWAAPGHDGMEVAP